MKTSENISYRQNLAFENTEKGCFCHCQSAENHYRYNYKNTSTFTGKELDQETGFSYFGARYLDHALATAWLSVDPKADKYPSISSYAYCAWNPIKLVDSEGDSIDVSKLNANQIEQYNNAIERLNKNPIFRYYYSELNVSNTIYTIEMLDKAAEFGTGKFAPETNTIAFVNSIHIISQELFHAYQELTGLYDENDKSVRETEGDIVSYLITMYLGVGCTDISVWDNGISINPNYVNTDYSIKMDLVYSSQFDIDFSIAVDKRVAYYSQRAIELNTKQPPSYTQKNSGNSALALKKILLSLED